MRARSALLLALASAAACVRTREVTLPELDPDARSMIMIIEPESRDPYRHAFTIPARAWMQSIPEPAQASLLTFRATLDELQLEDGALPGHFPDERRTPPPALQAFAASFDGSDPVAWRTLDAAPEVLLPPIELSQCSADDRCLRDELCKAECAVLPAAPPEAPQLPMLTPCPPGWSTRMIGVLEVCEPLPNLAPGLCPEDQARFAGNGACEPVGARCASEDFPANTPPGAIFVRANEPPPNDGTRDHPFADLATAFAALGDPIYVAPGAHSAVTIARNVELIGACPGRTELTGVVSVATATATIRGITIAGGGIVVGAASVLELDGVIIRDAAGVALLVDGGRVNAENFVVRRAASGAIQVRSSGHLSLTRARLEQFQGTGVDVVGSGAVIRELVASGGAPAMPGTHGYGLFARELANVVVERSLFEQIAGWGVVADRGTTITGSDLVVRDVSVVAMNTSQGVSINDGSHGRFSRVVIERASGIGLNVVESALVASDIVSSCTRTVDDLNYAGNGTFYGIGSSGELRRAYSHGDAGAGLRMFYATSIDVEDVIVEGTCAEAPQQAIAGVLSGASAWVGRRLEVRDRIDQGIQLDSAPALIRLEDVRVVGAKGNGFFIREVMDDPGMVVGVSIERARVEGSAIDGFRLLGAVELTCADCSISGARGPETRAVLLGPRSVSRWERFELSEHQLGLLLYPEAESTFEDGRVFANELGARAESREQLVPLFENATFTENGRAADVVDPGTL